MPQWSDWAYHWSGSLQCPADVNKKLCPNTWLGDWKSPHKKSIIILQINCIFIETWPSSRQQLDNRVTVVVIAWTLVLVWYGCCCWACLLLALWPLLRHVFFYVFLSRSSSSSGRLSETMAWLADWSAQSQMTGWPDYIYLRYLRQAWFELWWISWLADWLINLINLIKLIWLDNLDRMWCDLSWLIVTCSFCALCGLVVLGALPCLALLH